MRITWYQDDSPFACWPEITHIYIGYYRRGYIGSQDFNHTFYYDEESSPINNQVFKVKKHLMWMPRW